MNTVYDFLKSKKTLWGLGIIALVSIVLIVVFVVSNKNSKNNQDDLVVNDADDVSSIVMQPVVVDSYTYEFDGINWQFPVEERGTRVNFMLENFSRTEGAIVTFGKPYKLGFYQGECREIESLSYDLEANPGIPLSYAKCVSPGVTQQFVLFQQGEEIVAKVRRMYEEIEGDSEPEFTALYTVNLTEIVK